MVLEVRVLSPVPIQKWSSGYTHYNQGSFAHALIELFIKYGPLAEWLQQTAHNRKILGSSPRRSTILFRLVAQLVRAPSLYLGNLSQVQVLPGLPFLDTHSKFFTWSKELLILMIANEVSSNLLRSSSDG